jgi:riboflavin kinase
VAQKPRISSEGNALPKIVFEGTVFSGSGEGKRFVSLPWVKTQVEQKLGFTPYDGTLNIRLTKQSIQNKHLLESTKGVAVTPQAGYFPGVLFEAVIKGLKCAIVIPKTPNYPLDVLEVIADVCLRQKLCLADGSKAKVTVNI